MCDWCPSVRPPLLCFGFPGRFHLLDSKDEVFPHTPVSSAATPAAKEDSWGGFTKVPEVPFEEAEMDELALSQVSRVVS